MATDLLDLSLDAITEKNKAEYRSNKGSGRGRGGKGRGRGNSNRGRGGGKGRGGFKGGAMRQNRGYQARRQSPYGGGVSLQPAMMLSFCAGARSGRRYTMTIMRRKKSTRRRTSTTWKRRSSPSG